MAIVCPSCGNQVHSENILDLQNMVFCDYCNEVNLITEIKDNANVTQDKSEGKTNKVTEERAKSFLDYYRYLEDIKTANKAKKVLNSENLVNFTKKEMLEKLKNYKRRIKMLVIFAILGLIIAIIIGGINYSSMRAKYYIEYEEKLDYSRKYNDLLDTYEQSKDIWRIKINKIEIGNYNIDNETWIDSPGKDLYVKKMKRFKPKIIYESVINQELTLFIKYINPNGELVQNENSPENFTYSVRFWPERANSREAWLTSYAGSDIFISGEWIVEIWYQNLCLRRDVFNILE